MAQKSFESLPDALTIIEKVKCIVKWFKHSVTGSDQLRKKTEHKLIQSVSTRWNSTFYMLERFIELIETVASIINFNKSAPPMPSATDIEFLQEFCKMFRHVEFATTQASGEKFVTASCVIPVVKMMRNKINSVVCCSELGKALHENLIGQCNKRFGGIEHNQFFALASLLDPRFKNMHFDDKGALGNWVRKLNNEVKEEAESSDSDNGQVPPSIPSTRG